MKRRMKKFLPFFLLDILDFNIHYIGEPGPGGTPPAGDPPAGDPPNPDSFMDFTDPITKQKLQIPKEMQPLLGHIISATRKDTTDKYAGLEETIRALKSENDEFKTIKQEFEKIQQEKLTAEERAQINATKVIQEHEKKTKEAVEKATIWEKLFKETIVKNEIMSAFGSNKLCNPEQVAILFEKEGNARVEEKVDLAGRPTGRYETVVTLSIENDKGILELETGTPKELFSKWIKMESNAHHLQNDLKPGGGTGKKVLNAEGKKVDLSEIKDPVARMNLARGAGGAK